MNLNIKPKEKSKKEKQKLHIKHNTYNKGITLIALIITIVILLILAVVTISAVQGDGIIGYAKKAKNEWEKASEEEQQQLIDLEVGVAGGPWKSEGDKVINIKTKEELKVGDYVNYNVTPTDGASDGNLTYTSPKSATGADQDQTFNATNNGIKWQVLDVQNGKIRLISEKFVEPTSGGQSYSGKEDNSKQTNSDNHKYFTLKGKTGFINGIDELNNICAIYGHGKGAESATSITVEDVNRITGYDPAIAKCGEGTINEYGKTVTYTLGSDGKVSSDFENGENASANGKDINSFNYYDKSTRSFKNLISGENGISITSTFYKYYPTNLKSDVNADHTHGVIKKDDGTLAYNGIYQMIFGKWKVVNNQDIEKEDNNEEKFKFEEEEMEYSTRNPYWLASDFAETLRNRVCYGLRYITAYVSRVNLCETWENSEDACGFGVRPVVTLKSDVQLSKGSSGGTTEANVATWNVEQ